jgi:hypothetical protein
MAQPVKLYICYAPEDETALSYLKKSLRLLEIPGHIQSWHRGRLLPGDNHAQKIAEQLGQAQAIIMLVSLNFFSSEYYESAEMIYARRLYQEKKVRVIPVIVEHCPWKETDLGELEPLPRGGKPAGRDDKAWKNVTEGIIAITKDIQAEQAKKEPDPPASPTTARGKARKTTRTKAQPRTSAALIVESPITSPAPRPTRRRNVPQVTWEPEPADEELPTGPEPEPATPEAKSATPTYDQNYGKLENDVKQIKFDILVWEPTRPVPSIVTDERRVIYHALKKEQHQCWLGTQLQVPAGLSLQDREIEQARDANMTVLLVEESAIGEMQAFCSDYDEKILNKTRCFYPKVLKSPPGTRGLDEMMAISFHLDYYQEEDITHCHVRTEVLEWVDVWRGIRYRQQRRSGR